jgi:hypothetical protein
METSSSAPVRAAMGHVHECAIMLRPSPCDAAAPAHRGSVRGRVGLEQRARCPLIRRPPPEWVAPLARTRRPRGGSFAPASLPLVPAPCPSFTTDLLHPERAPSAQAPHLPGQAAQAPGVLPPPRANMEPPGAGGGGFLLPGTLGLLPSAAAAPGPAARGGLGAPELWGVHRAGPASKAPARGAGGLGPVS